MQEGFHTVYKMELNKQLVDNEQMTREYLSKRIKATVLFQWYRVPDLQGGPLGLSLLAPAGGAVVIRMLPVREQLSPGSPLSAAAGRSCATSKTASEWVEKSSNVTWDFPELRLLKKSHFHYFPLSATCDRRRAGLKPQTSDWTLVCSCVCVCVCAAVYA